MPTTNKNSKRIDIWIDKHPELSPYMIIALTSIFNESNGTKSVDDVTKEELLKHKFIGLKGWDKFEGLRRRVRRKKKKIRHTDLRPPEIDAVNNCMIDLMNHYNSTGDPEDWINFEVLKKVVSERLGKENVAIII